MDFFKPKHKENNVIMDDYNNWLQTYIATQLPVIKQQSPIIDLNGGTPKWITYELLIHNNYNIKQLKEISTYNKLKKTGNKTQLILRIFSFLYLSNFIIKIQKHFRGFLQRYLNTLRGPALLKRKLCHNESDFASIESLDKIVYDQFFSFKDKDDFIYGFDIASLSNLIETHIKTSANKNKKLTNPYNRLQLPDLLFANLRRIITITKLLNRNINLLFEDDTVQVSPEKVIEFRCIKLFQEIDALGNYSDHMWFLSLSKVNLIKFIRDLADIWNYRANLTNETKSQICPPYGDLFSNVNIHHIYSQQDVIIIRRIILETIEKLVYNGINADSKSLGAYYILSALTLVNQNAAIALPWLFQSVSYH
jgi:hypothetical protein